MVWAEFQNLKNNLQHVIVFVMLENNIEGTEVLKSHDVISEACLLTTIPIRLSSSVIGKRLEWVILLNSWTRKHLVNVITNYIRHVHAKHFILELATVDCLL